MYYPPPLTKVNPDVYYDFSQGSNDAEDRETVHDLSGNGNDARLYNFGFTDGSGYQDGALVFDDVDDYGVIIKRGDFEKCTMLMLCTPISKRFGANSILIDTRGNANNIFYINNYPADAIAFPGSNVGNICINNIQNNVLTVQQLNNKKVLISRTGAISNEDSNPIYLGTNKYFNAYSGMALYKFLLFDRELNQEEIDKVIQDYHLLDGVDDVWNEV